MELFLTKRLVFDLQRDGRVNRHKGNNPEPPLAEPDTRRQAVLRMCQ